MSVALRETLYIRPTHFSFYWSQNAGRFLGPEFCEFSGEAVVRMIIDAALHFDVTNYHS